MLQFKEGDRVQIAARPTTAEDAKSGLYYAYYARLSGTIFKVYGKGPETRVAVDIDLDSLPDDVACRHLETRNQMYATLSGEAKRLSAPGSPQEFRLRYVVLVAVSDLTRNKLKPV
jgi:hypothetical protein